MVAADRSRKFEEVLAAYLEARERGERVDPAAIVRAHPEIAGELREFFANERQFASAAAGLGVATPSVRSPGTRIGEYEILGEIARGGMGIVYRARHARLQRVVALKMMLVGDAVRGDGLRRFRTEAEVVADLDHPNIVPIYDVGECDGHAYFTMKLIDGPSLKERVADYVGKPEEAVRVIIAIARAVHHAHQRGVLHRDLKPGNILMSRREPAKPKQDAYPVAGIPKHAQNLPRAVVPFVSDFGLAKRVGVDGWASHSTAVVGTAAYMAPEQATGKQALTVAADVYSLGAMLFELLTGRPPFVGQNQMEVLLQAVEKEPPSPLTLQSDLDSDLAHVCLKCLQKNPQERYASAEALAEELEAWLNGDALTVRAPTTLERFGRWCRRHPLGALLTCVILTLVALLVGGSIGVNWYLSDLNEQLVDASKRAEENEGFANKKAESEAAARADAENSHREAVKAKLELQAALAKEKDARQAELGALERNRRLLVQEYMANAQQMTQRGDPGAALVWYAAALEQDQGNAERELAHRIRLGAAMRQMPALAQMWFFDAKPRFTRVSPKGDRLFVGLPDGTARLYDCASGQTVGAPVAASVAAVFSPDSRHLAVVGSEHTVTLFDAKTGAARPSTIKHADAINSIAYSSDGHILATGSSDKTARLWDVDTGKPIGKALTHAQEVRLVLLHPGGKKLLTVSEAVKNKKSDLYLWDLTSGSATALLIPSNPGILTACFSKDSPRVFAISTARKLHQWYTTGAPVNTTTSLPGKGNPGLLLAPTRDRLLQIVDNDVKVLDLPKGSTLHTLAHESAPYLARFSGGGRFVVTATANRGVRLWKNESPASVLPNAGMVVDVQTSRDDRWLATVGEDHCVRLWDLASLRAEPLPGMPAGKHTLAGISPDGKTVLHAWWKGGTGTLWNFVEMKQVGAALTFPGPIAQAAWADDGKTLAIATRDEARVFDAHTGKPVSPTLRLDEGVVHLRHAAGEIVLWNASQARGWDLAGNVLWQRKFTKQIHPLDCDGPGLALWRNKGTLEIQETRGAKTKPLLKLAIVPELFRFSPDGKRGLAAFGDGSLRVWDLSTGRPLTLPFSQGATVRQVAWSPDGNLLASADASGRVCVWESTTGSPLMPPTAALGSTVRLRFTSDGRTLLAWTADGIAESINLTPRQGNPADLLRLVQVSAGQELHEMGGTLVPLEPARQQQLWRELRLP